MAQSHDARLTELVTDLGGDDLRFLFRDLVQKAWTATTSAIGTSWCWPPTPTASTGDDGGIGCET